MIRVRDKETGTDLGTITEEELSFLVGELEEESSTDHDYYISRDELEILKEQGADPNLVALLTTAMGPRDGVEIEWSAE